MKFILSQNEYKCTDPLVRQANKEMSLGFYSTLLRIFHIVRNKVRLLAFLCNNGHSLVVFVMHHPFRCTGYVDILECNMGARGEPQRLNVINNFQGNRPIFPFFISTGYFALF